MGTWAAGPYGNDAALDFVADVVAQLMSTVNEFVETPQIDESFDPAFAAIDLLNAIMERTPSRPWADGGVVDGAPIRDAMLRCYDEQIDSMAPDPDFKVDQRAALVTTLDAFVKHLQRGR